MKDRDSNKVNAKVVENTKSETLQEFVVDNTTDDTTVYSDEATAYSGLPQKYDSVTHSVGEYVQEQVHINGMESFGLLLKRGYYGMHLIAPIWNVQEEVAIETWLLWHIPLYK